MADIAGPYTTVFEAGISFTGWWLKDPVDPTRNYQPTFYGSSFMRSRKEELAEFNPLGRKFPVVLRGMIRGERLTLPFEAITQEDFDKFELIRSGQRTLLLQRGYATQVEEGVDRPGEQWYISLGSERVVDEAGYDTNFRRWTMEAVEVDVL